MRRIAALIAIGSLASAASGLALAQASGNSGGSPSDRDAQARIARNVADSASPPHGPAAIASAAATSTADRNAEAEARADLAARRAGDHGKLKIDRVNLKGKAAAPALQQGTSPVNYDHSISMGDMQHTQQVTNVKVYVKKPAQ